MIVEWTRISHFKICILAYNWQPLPVLCVLVAEFIVARAVPAQRCRKLCRTLVYP